MRKFISLILSLNLLLVSLPAFSAGGDFEKVFSAGDTDMTGFEIAEGYIIDENGLSDINLSRSIKYAGNTFGGKYEYEITFRCEFENSSKILFNYKDRDNYSYIEIQPETKKASLKAINGGAMITGGLYDIPNEITSDTWVTAKVLSNGGKGISLSLSTGGDFSEVFSNKYLKNAAASGYIGYDAVSNPLIVKRMSVKDLGEADFVEPETVTTTDEEAKKNDEAVSNTQVAERSDDVLKLMCGLGIMKATENGLDGGAYVELEEMKEIAVALKSYYAGTDKYIKETTALDFIFSLLRFDIDMTQKEKYSLAINMGLLKNTAYTGNSFISRYDMAQLIYNSFEQPMFYDNERCLFEDVLKLSKIEGQVTDNGITALDSKSKIGIGNIAVNGLVFENKTDWRAAELIGRMVEGYYDEEDRLLYVALDKNEEFLHIDASKVEDFSDNTFTYENESTSKRKKTSVKPGASLIYNGEHMASYKDEIFENIENGDITLISSDGSKDYDTIIVEAYKNFVVASIFESELTLYNAAYDTKNEDNRLYKVDLSDYEFVEIFAADGTPMKFEDLKVDYALSVAASTNYLKLIVSTTQEVGFTVSSITEDSNGKTIVSNGEKTYAISPSYFKAYEHMDIKTGVTYTFVINNFGDITWAILAANYSYESGCLANVTLDQDNGFAYLHVFEADGEIQYLKTADKVKFIDEYGKIKKLNSEEVYNALKDKNELVTYMQNSEDFVVELQLPYDGYKSDCPNKYMKLCDVAKNQYTYKDVAYAFGYKYFFGNIKRMFTVTSEEAKDPKRYGVISAVSKFVNGSSYKMKCYSENSEYLVDYAIIYDYQTGKSTPTIRNRELVVTDVEYGYYDGEAKYKISGYSSSEVAVFCEPEVAENAYDIFSYKDKENAEKKYRVQKGDIIKYSTDYITGDITDIVIIYRDTELHPETGSKGWLLGAKTTADNPFAIDTSYGITLSPTREVGSGRRYLYGWVYDVEGGVITVTTQDLSHYPNYYKWNNPDSTEFISEYHTSAAYPGVTLTQNEDTGEMSVSASKSIRTFKDYGPNCSRVLMCVTSSQNYYFMVVLNN